MEPEDAIRWEEMPPRGLTAHSGRFYNYAPSVIREGKTLRCWWCRNAQEGVFRDTIFYGTADANGTEQIAVRDAPVLVAGSSGTWDSFHVCDPSVIRGDFLLSGDYYSYALFYLGNDLNASRHNQIGVAFAKRPEGPWMRFPDPVVSHSDTRAWGVGQPSAVGFEREKRVLLFYTQGDREGTRLRLRTLDLSGNAPRVQGDDVTLPIAGLTRSDRRPETVLHNADVAYEESHRRFWIVREQHPHPTENPSYIGSALQIASIDADDARRGRGTWRGEGEITPDVTGQARNHNAGWVRTPRGSLDRESGKIAVCISSARVMPPGQRAEWTYDLFLLRGTIR